MNEQERLASHPERAGAGGLRRREFVTVLAGVATWPLAGHAQQPERMRRIGVLMIWCESDPL
jgi:putative tryptophan/tyrosine transport system substrate-binding protein